MRLADPVQRDGNLPRLCQGKRLNFGLVFPVTVGKNLEQEAEFAGMSDQVDCERPEHCFPAGEDDMDRAEPMADVRQDLFPLFGGG